MFVFVLYLSSPPVSVFYCLPAKALKDGDGVRVPINMISEVADNTQQTGPTDPLSRELRSDRRTIR